MASDDQIRGAAGGGWWRTLPGRARLLSVAGAAAFLLLAWQAPDPGDARVQRRIEAGVNLKAEDYAVLTLRPAALLNVVLCLALAATAGWWARPLEDRRRADAASAGPAVTGARGRVGSGAWWGALVLAVGMAAAARWPLAHRGLWWDEVWTLRRAVLGELRPEEGVPSRLHFKPTSWERTLWNYSKPTNHVCFSVASRLSLGAWRLVHGRDAAEFDEFALRLPAYLAGLLSVVLLAVLLRDWGRPGAGLAAAFLLALHPWHIRYSIDARAFSFVVLFALGASFAMGRALRRASWGWCLAFGAAVFLLLWSFPHTIFLVGAFAAAGGAGLLIRQGPGAAARLAVALLLAAMGFLQIAAPWFPQVARWTDVAGNEMVTWPFVRQFWITLVCGVPGALDATPDNAGLVSLAGMARGCPALPLLVWGIVPALVAAGAVRWARESCGLGWVLAAWGLAAPVSLVAAWAGNHYFYDRYLIYTMAFVVAWLCVGVDWLGAVLGRMGGRVGRIGSSLCLGLLVACWAWSTAPARRVLDTRPYAPTREVAEWGRTRAGADPLSVVRVGCGLGGDTPAVYDPWIRWAIGRDDLLAELEAARRAGKQLVCFYGYNAFNRAREAGEAKARGDAETMFRYLDDPGLFRLVATFGGIEGQFFYRMFEYTGVPTRRGIRPRHDAAGARD